MKTNLKKNIGLFILTFIIPGSIAFLIRKSFKIYNLLILPKLAPPNIVFPIVWSILYILMSISICLVKENSGNKIIYFIQLALNALWSLIFFYYKNYLLALIELIILFIISVYMTYRFNKFNNKTFYLLLPYLLWLTFAFYLNYFVWLYN